jgi:glycosyltransferase involved in cell wall biosynthesis
MKNSSIPIKRENSLLHSVEPGMRLKRICIVSEALRNPFDEGVKLFVFNFIKALTVDFEVLAVGRFDNVDGEIEKVCSKALPQNRLFISFNLRSKIRAFNPDLIFYLPTAQATIYSFLRARVLKFYARGARTVLITLQPRRYTAIIKKIVPFVAPDLVLAQSAKTQQALNGLGCTVRRIASGVDLQKFKPASRSRKEVLRRKYGLAADRFVVLHVGHINRNRNMHFLDQIQRLEAVQAVVVGSSTYSEDRQLAADLKAAGVVVITGYLKRIEELYQCADCYLFPVFSEGACIEIPLSVLEAMACNLPVVTTRYGGLPDLIRPREDFRYAASDAEMLAEIDWLKEKSDPRTRELVERFSWSNVFRSALAESMVN